MDKYAMMYKLQALLKDIECLDADEQEIINDYIGGWIGFDDAMAKLGY